MDVDPSAATDAACFSAGAHALPVDRCSLRERRLLDDYVLASRPVVVTDAAEQWPARRRWTLSFFRERYGSQIGETRGRSLTVAEYLDCMEASTAEAPAPYPFNFDMIERFPELIADVAPHPLFGEIDRLNHPLMWKSLLKGTRPHELFFGGHGSVFRPLHIDTLYLHGHITQILGDKEFFLFPPEQTPLMYPRPDNPKQSAIDHPLKPDLQRFALYAQARPYRVVISPGETLFFPAGWWHFTRLHGPCISYGGVGLTRANWPAFIRDNHAHRAQQGVAAWKLDALLAYGAVAGAAMNAHESSVRWMRSFKSQDALAAA